jgi:hypothetical protein
MVKRLNEKSVLRQAAQTHEKPTGVGSKIIIHTIQCDHHLETQLSLKSLSLLYRGSAEESSPVQRKPVQQSESF